MILKQGKVNQNKIDMLGRTPLFYTTQNIYKEVVKILLGQEEFNLDRVDILHRTQPLNAS